MTTQLRFALRRDRLLISLWLVSLAAIAGISASATKSLYPAEELRVQAAQVVNNSPALIAFYGKIYDPSSLGALSMLKLGVLGAAMVGVFAVILVNRHTRADEESGRCELTLSAPVSRRSPVLIAIVVLAIAMVLLALLTCLALVLGGLDFSGSLWFGIGWALVGCAFGAVTLIAAQIASSARGTTILGIGVIGVSYLIRAVADAVGGLSWLGWLSPLGVGQRIAPFERVNLWAVLILFCISVGCVCGALALAQRRDFGAGLLAQRRGRESGNGVMVTLGGLVVRENSAAFFVWLAWFVTFAIVAASITTSITDFLNTPSSAALIRALGGGQALVNAYFITIASFFAVMSVAFAIMVIVRSASDEGSGKLEHVLSAPVSKSRWLTTQFVVAFTGATVLQLAGAAVLSMTLLIVSPNSASTGALFANAAGFLPAVWALAALGVLFYAVNRTLAIVGWIALALVVLISEVGPLLKLNHWLMDLSPMTHVMSGGFGGNVTIAEWSLVVLTAGLFLVALATFGQRNIAN